MKKKKLGILLRNCAIPVLFAAIAAFAEVQAQQTGLSGRIVDPQGQPLSGATVVEKGTSNGTVSGIDGRFTLNVSPGTILTVSYVGYINADVPASEGMTVVMTEGASLLDDVVVVGYGTVVRRDLTAAVSSVDTEDIDRRAITTLSSAIQGKAAGVQVSQPSGQPGEGMIVRIRGASSLTSSNDPLYVVDGVPVGEGEYAISYLSPNDIESMDILKDASAAAIYGSRAANGVVLITTKNGSTGEARVSFSAYAGISNVQRTFDVLNVEQYGELMEEIGALTLPDGLRDETDWFDETYQTGINQNYQLSVSGGSEKVNYYASGGYTNDTGIIGGSFYERFNFKTSMDAQVRKWIKFSTNVTYSHYRSNGIISGTGSNRAGVVMSVVNTPTYAKAWSETNPDHYWEDFYGANLTTPAENVARTADNFSTTDRLIATAGVTIDIIKGLTFKSTVSMDSRWTRDFTFLHPLHTAWGRDQKGTASDTRAADRRMIYDNILTYDLDLGKHRIGLMAGTSATTSLWENLSGSRSNFSTTNTIIGLNGGNNGGLRGQSAGKAEWAIMSYLARATYSYDGKYLLTVNLRADGSSKLAPDYRWGYFPSFSTAWRISGEDFMKDIRWIDDLKLRVGWGQIGNQSGLSEYAYLQRYNTTYYDWTNPDYTDAVPTVSERANMKNEKLTWETTTTTNIGIDFAVLNNRLSFSVDAYYKYTEDMLMTIDFSSQPSILRNEAAMSNRGVEFTISSKNFTGDFAWDSDFNMSFNRNRIEDLDLTQVYYYGNTSELINESAIRMTVGQPLSMFWGYIAEGVDPETGMMIYSDLNGNGISDVGDKTYIGNANPKFTFGMTNNFSWRGLNLNVLITGSYGNDILNASKVDMVGMIDGKNQITDVLDRWQIPGQITDMPKSGEYHNIKMSTRWIEDGSYLKVKNITLSYNFTHPKLRAVNISRIQPYVTLQNFITWTNYSGYDPEVSQYQTSTTMGIDWGTYPNVKTVIFGVNIDF